MTDILDMNIYGVLESVEDIKEKIDIDAGERCEGCPLLCFCESDVSSMIDCKRDFDSSVYPLSNWSEFEHITLNRRNHRWNSEPSQWDTYLANG